MIIRVRHDADNPYFLLNRAACNDSSLSFKALGIHTYLMSKPDHWTVQEADLAARHAEGTAAVRSGLKELKERGYLESVPVRDAAGRVTRWETHVYECAIAPETQNVENPHSGKATDRKTEDIVISDSLVINDSLSLSPADPRHDDPRIILSDPVQGPKTNGVHAQAGLDPRQLQNGHIAAGQGKDGYQVWREFFDFVPGRAAREEFQAIEPAALQRWRDVLRAYALSGKPSNWYSVQLEWLRDGIPAAWDPKQSQKGNANGNAKPATHRNRYQAPRRAAPVPEADQQFAGLLTQ